MFHLFLCYRGRSWFRFLFLYRLFSLFRLRFFAIDGIEINLSERFVLLSYSLSWSRFFFLFSGFFLLLFLFLFLILRLFLEQFFSLCAHFLILCKGIGQRLILLFRNFACRFRLYLAKFGSLCEKFNSGLQSDVEFFNCFI